MTETGENRFQIDESLQKELEFLPQDTPKTELPQRLEQFMRTLAERDATRWISPAP